MLITLDTTLCIMETQIIKLIEKHAAGKIFNFFMFLMGKLP